MHPVSPKPFGNTGESVPALSMGCGFPFGFVDFPTAIHTIRHALDRGITYFDTSPLYRHGASQALLGEALAGRPEKIFLATKIGHFKNPRHFRSIDALQTQLHENLRLLRRDSVDLLQIHEADWDHWWTDRQTLAPCELFDLQNSHNFQNAPVFDFLRESQSKGLCKYIGITGNNAPHLAALLEKLTGIDSILIAYNYHPLNASAQNQILPLAKQKGIAAIIAGIFTFIRRIPEGWRTEGTYFGQHADRQLAEFQALQKSSDLSPEELSLRFVAADPDIATLLLGACTPGQVDQNLRAFAQGPLPPDLHKKVESIATQFSLP